MPYRVRHGDSWSSLELQYPGIQGTNKSIKNPKPGMVLTTPFQFSIGAQPSLTNSGITNPPPPKPGLISGTGLSSVTPMTYPGKTQYVSPTVVPTTYNVGGRGGMQTQAPDYAAAMADVAAAEAIKEAMNPEKKYQKTHFQVWAEGGLSGKQMRAMYGKGWKDRMKIRAPKGKVARANARTHQSDKGNPWYNTPTTNGVAWRS